MTGVGLTGLWAAVLMTRYLSFVVQLDVLNYSVSQAGRHADLDVLAQRFLAVTGEARNAIYKEAQALAQGIASKHYIRVMEKVFKDSEAYIEKESKR